ncbi:hypothetical protein EYC80_007257 [Monilinia laxa]|uniref:Uncharacterized protein n=1 Tax=Monilinia laxa TaxID=61186 RepID=A0A5N6JU44_MONLA|nr:hypothetical protein EYC80_007257 [Monilinia laxa]
MSTEIEFGHPTRDEPIEFWRSQLEFRGFSSRGRDINALKERLVNADTDEMSFAVAEGLEEIIGKNNLAARKFHELNRPGGLARPRTLMSQDEVDRLAGMRGRLGSIPKVERRRFGLDHMSGVEIKHHLDINSSQRIPEENQDINGENESGKER